MIICQFITIISIILLACLISTGIISLIFRDKKHKEVYCKLEVYRYEQVLELQKWLVNHIREKSTLDTYLHIFLDYTKNIDLFTSAKSNDFNNKYMLAKEFYNKHNLSLGCIQAATLLASTSNIDFITATDYIYSINKRYKYLSSRSSSLSDYPIAITEGLSLEQIKYLKWHCPIKFVRECLVKYCGMKDHWYYRLGFRY